jgi:hypothetical protein
MTEAERVEARRYGVEIWATDHVVTGRYARGAVVVGQALFRRLITPRGTLRGGDEEAAYGLDLSAYVGAVGDAVAVAALPGLVRAELLKDDRVSDVSVTTAADTDSAGHVTITLTIDVVLAESGEALALTVAVDDLTVELLALRVEPIAA